MDQGNLLRHHADIDRVTPQVSIAVKPKRVLETSDQSDVALESDIRILAFTNLRANTRAPILGGW
jgi:hypothetical protein